jgi:hypothetical protein
MSGVRSAGLPLSQGCPCTGRHSPSVYVPNAHHIVPDSWGGPTTPDNLAVICPSTHTAVHALLDLYVHLGRQPTRAEVMGKLGRRPVPLVLDLAARAWAGRPAHPTPTSLL